MNKIIHHGAIDGVTGSCHELQWHGNNNELNGILIDCGLFQGAEISNDGSSFDQLKINFPIKHIQALVVTHVHIDHVGRIPYLIAAAGIGRRAEDWLYPKPQTYRKVPATDRQTVASTGIRYMGKN